MMSREKVFWIAGIIIESLTLLINAFKTPIPWWVGALGSLFVGTIAMGIYEGVKCSNNRTIIVEVAIFEEGGITSELGTNKCSHTVT